MQVAKFAGIILVVISLMMIFISLIRKNESFFNITEVIRNHFQLFKKCKYQYVVFYLLPLIFAVGLSLIYEAGEAFYTELSVIIGILLSMLFAILSILSTHDFESVHDNEQRKKVKNVVLQTSNAIVFNSILCLFIMIYGLFNIVLDGVTFGELPLNTAIIKIILSCIAYYVFIVILLTLLLIVKQMSRIIEFSLKVKKQ